MALGSEVIFYLRNITLFNMTLNEFLVRIIVAVILLIIGVFLGKLIGKAIRKILSQVKIREKSSESFFNLLVWVIEISIYILFINIALNLLSIPILTKWLTNVLIIIPAFVGALILIGLGFAVAVYLKSIIEESNVVGWRILSMMFFYFVIYISMIYAVKTALITIDKQVVNYMIMILTAIIGAGVAYYHAKKK